MADSQQPGRPAAADLQELQEIVRKANAGDQRALSQLRQFLDRNPGVWRHVGDLARVAQTAWISLISGGDTLSAEAVRRQLRELRQDLLGDAPNAVEKLLADSVIATWIEVKFLESASAESGGTLTQTSHLLKRLESAQRRHLAAVKQLVQIRKLLPNAGALPELRIFPGDRETA